MTEKNNEDVVLEKLTKPILLLGSLLMLALVALLVVSASALPSFKFPVLTCQDGWKQLVVLLAKDPWVFVMIFVLPLYILLQVTIQMRKGGLLIDAFRLPIIARYLFVCFYGIFAIIFFFAICIPIP